MSAAVCCAAVDASTGGVSAAVKEWREWGSEGLMVGGLKDGRAREGGRRVGGARDDEGVNHGHKSRETAHKCQVRQTLRPRRVSGSTDLLIREERRAEQHEPNGRVTHAMRRDITQQQRRVVLEVAGSRIQSRRVVFQALWRGLAGERRVGGGREEGGRRAGGDCEAGL